MMVQTLRLVFFIKDYAIKYLSDWDNKKSPPNTFVTNNNKLTFNAKLKRNSYAKIDELKTYTGNRDWLENLPGAYFGYYFAVIGDLKVDNGVIQVTFPEVILAQYLGVESRNYWQLVCGEDHIRDIDNRTGWTNWMECKDAHNIMQSFNTYTNSMDFNIDINNVSIDMTGRIATSHVQSPKYIDESIKQVNILNLGEVDTCELSYSCKPKYYGDIVEIDINNKLKINKIKMTESFCNYENGIYTIITSKNSIGILLTPEESNAIGYSKEFDKLAILERPLELERSNGQILSRKNKTPIETLYFEDANERYECNVEINYELKDVNFKVSNKRLKNSAI